MGFVHILYITPQQPCLSASRLAGDTEFAHVLCTVAGGACGQGTFSRQGQPVQACPEVSGHLRFSKNSALSYCVYLMTFHCVAAAAAGPHKAPGGARPAGRSDTQAAVHTMPSTPTHNDKPVYIHCCCRTPRSARRCMTSWPQ
jgi:hypothetical protein